MRWTNPWVPRGIVGVRGVIRDQQVESDAVSDSVTIALCGDLWHNDGCGWPHISGRITWKREGIGAGSMSAFGKSVRAGPSVVNWQLHQDPAGLRTMKASEAIAEAERLGVWASLN